MGARYWEDRLARAKEATAIYGWGILVVVALMVLAAIAKSQESDVELPLRFLAWFGAFVLTFMAGAEQAPLLPFMGAKPIGHWISLTLFSLAGPFGLVMWLVMRSYNSKAEASLRLAISECGDAAEEVPRPISSLVQVNAPPVQPVRIDEVSTEPSRVAELGIDRDVIEKLERLDALRRSGALTDTEFVAEKTRLLRREH